MNCPKCNTVNEPNSSFCVNCGESLSDKAVTKTAPLANSPKELLGLLTIRTVVILIGLWLVHLILNWLPFVTEMRIPGININMPVIITSVIYFVIVIVLLSYAKMLRVLWQQSFPQAPEFGSVLAALVYLGILVAVYYAIRPLLRTFITDPNIITIFQVILFVIAIMLIVPALSILYQSMPRWMAAIRRYSLADTGNQVACLSCGHINQADQQHCSQCGAKLVPTS
jgi:hypothetical protein